MTKSWRSLLIIAACTGLSLVAANWLLQRVEAGQLFLFPLPFDRPASALEELDAIQSAKFWRPTALLTVLILGGMISWLELRFPHTSKLPARLGRWDLLLIAAVLADLGSTLYFFHIRSIELEVHPAIRLFGYAFGRTTGPVLAKGIQLFGILWLGQLWPKWRTQLLITASLLSRP